MTGVDDILRELDRLGCLRVKEHFPGADYEFIDIDRRRIYSSHRSGLVRMIDVPVKHGEKSTVTILNEMGMTRRPIPLGTVHERLMLILRKVRE